jgi:hypothetical protein
MDEIMERKRRKKERQNILRRNQRESFKLTLTVTHNPVEVSRSRL